MVGVDVNATSGGNAMSLFNGTWDLGTNGEWNSGRTGFVARTYVGGPTTIGFNFATPVSSVGAFMNDAPGTYPMLVIFAYDSAYNLLESYDIWADGTIFTPDGINDGVFRGISRPTADIMHFNINGYRPAIDDLTFGYSGVNSVPEPGTMVLLGTGLLGLVSYGRKKLKRGASEFLMGLYKI